MKIEINNIGIVENASIECNDITLITGKNGSGKSTVGKAITSMALALKNDKATFVRDCSNYFFKKIESFSEGIYFFIGGISFAFQGDDRDRHFSDDEFEEFEFITNISKKRKNIDDYELLLKFAHDIENQLVYKRDRFLSLVNKYYGGNKRRRISVENATNFYDSCITETKDAIDNLEKYRDSARYLYESIKEELNYTFHGQLLPLGGDQTNSFIKILSNSKSLVYHHNSYEKTKLERIDELESSFYISDGCVLDTIDSFRKKSRTSSDGGLSPSILSLNDYLLEALSAKKNIVTQNMMFEKYPKVFDILNSVWPHYLLKQKGVTINSDSGLNIANEASGRKIFAILKTLLINGLISNDTLLVFDEPENHLHPEWQSLLAKLLIEMNASTGCKVICITHSPNILYAFDVLSKKRNANQCLNVYFSFVSNGKYEMVDCTNSIERAHLELVKPYIELDIGGD